MIETAIFIAGVISGMVIVVIALVWLVNKGWR